MDCAAHSQANETHLAKVQSDNVYLMASVPNHSKPTSINLPGPGVLPIITSNKSCKCQKGTWKRHVSSILQCCIDYVKTVSYSNQSSQQNLSGKGPLQQPCTWWLQFHCFPQSIVETLFNWSGLCLLTSQMIWILGTQVKLWLAIHNNSSECQFLLD